MRRRFLLFGLFSLLCATLAASQTPPGATTPQAPAAIDTLLSGLTLRNIGVFRTAAWVTSIGVPESPVRDHLYTIYAATRSGGLWKTINAGTTWTPISDSVGAAAV